MADVDRDISINGGDEDETRPEDYFDDAENEEEARVNELTQKLKSLEIEKRDLVNDYSESKDKIESLEAEIESLRKQDAALREKYEAMAREIELFEDGQKALESIRKRALELETEVFRLQHDLTSAMDEGDEAKKEVAELKKLIEEKDGRVVGLEKEVEDLKSGKIESEIRVRDLEGKIGVLEVKETEGKSEKVMIERELREKIGEREVEIGELKEKVENLATVIRREALELEKLKKENSRVEESLRASENKAKEMELKAGGLEGELRRAEKIISELKEKTIHAAANGKREIDDDIFEETSSSNLQWPVIMGGSAGAIAVVAAIAYIRYGKCSSN